MPQLLVLVGPTASGKTDLAIALAKKFHGEIVSADSRQLYRGTEIGSAIPFGVWKNIEGKRRYIVDGIPHYMMACQSPAKLLTVAQYQQIALRRIRDIVKRGKLPILVGGTGLYIRSIVDNFVIPPVAPDPVFRRSVEKLSSKKLFAMLVRVDPEYAKKISPENRRYCIRALEVYRSTGTTFSMLQSRGESEFDVLQIGIDLPRQVVYDRINERIDTQIKNGLINEATRLGKRYGWNSQTLTGLGHRQLGWCIEGKITPEEAVRLIKRDTRHYAKRQLTWFRRDKRVQWVKSNTTTKSLIRAWLKK